MECASEIYDRSEYLRCLNKKMTQQRVPVSGSIELTRSCNLKCIHCYLGRSSKDSNKVKLELNTSQWKQVIDEITEAGCLFLLMTGGELFLRNDFIEIYTYAKQKGLLITLFTNGTLISDEIVNHFKKYPPSAIEITVYGSTPETYERITGSKAAYHQCIRNINKLLDNQIRVKIKTILMKPNRHEFFDIKQMAKFYDVGFRSDACIFGCFDGNKAPLSLRVPAKAAVDMEMADEKKIHSWTDFYHRMKDVKPDKTLFQCGAGVTNFHIDAYGNLQPCLISTHMKYNIFQDGGFVKGWKDLMLKIREEKASGDILLCNQCEKRLFCGYCPAFFALETGSENQRADYLCEIGKYRYEKIINHHSAEL